MSLNKIYEIIENKQRVKNYFEKLRVKPNNSNTREHLIAKMNSIYNDKSNSKLAYFYNNIFHSYNMTTGEQYGKFRDNRGVSTCIGKITYYLDKFDGINYALKVKESREGAFLDSQYRTQSARWLAKVKYLEHYNQGKTVIFLTLTNPSKFHYYKKSDTSKNGFIKNNKCEYENYEESVEASLVNINTIYKYFNKQLNKKLSRKYKKLNKQVKKISPDYVKIIEPHKSLTAHLHRIIFIDADDYNEVKTVYENLIKKFVLTKTEFEIVKNKRSTYVMKYIMKTTKEDSNKLFRQYNSYFHKTRLFSRSDYKSVTQIELNKIYNYFKQVKPKLLKKFKSEDIPLYVLFEQMKKNKRFTFEYEKKSIKILDTKKLKRDLAKLELDIKENTYNKRIQDCEDSLAFNFINKKEYDLHKELAKKDRDKLNNIDLQKIKKSILNNYQTYIKTTTTKVLNKVFRKSVKIYDREDFKQLNEPLEIFRKYLLTPQILEIE